MNEGGTNLIDCQNSKYGFNRASTTQEMPDGPFGAADIDLTGPLLSRGTEKQRFDSSVFGRISDHCRGSMRVHVVYISRQKTGILQRLFHGHQGARTVFLRGRKVVRIP